MSELTDGKWSNLSTLLDNALALTGEIEANGPTPNSVSNAHGKIDSKLDDLKRFMDKYVGRLELPRGYEYTWTKTHTGNTPD